MEQIDHQAEIISQYANGPVQLNAVLKGLTDSDLDLTLTTDTWTIRQIVHHIVDGDDMWKTCIKAALGNSTGLFSLQWYWDRPQTDWAVSWKYDNRRIEPSLELFDANRQLLAELLQQIPNVLEQSIRIKHPDRDQEDRLTIKFVLEMQIGHLIDHIGEIQAIRLANNL